MKQGESRKNIYGVTRLGSFTKISGSHGSQDRRQMLFQLPYRFACDIAVLNVSEENQQKLIRKFHEESLQVGLKMDMKKKKKA